METPLKALLFLIISTTTAFGQGTILWDESVNGPLSNDGSSPTHLGVLQNATNSMLGATEYIPNGIYGDYFSFAVPSGSEVSKLWLSVDRPVAVWLGTADFSSEYGYVINPGNGDVLPQWALNSIGAGTLGMYIKNYDFNSGPSVANYRLDFFVQNVPEPGTLALVVLGLGAFCFRGWKEVRPNNSER